MSINWSYLSIFASKCVQYCSSCRPCCLKNRPFSCNNQPFTTKCYTNCSSIILNMCHIFSDFTLISRVIVAISLNSAVLHVIFVESLANVALVSANLTTIYDNIGTKWSISSSIEQPMLTNIDHFSANNKQCWLYFKISSYLSTFRGLLIS
jgi:hypothetical protein